MTAELAAVSWPLERLGEALGALGKRSGFSPQALESEDVVVAPPSDSTHSETRLECWVGTLAARIGLEAEPVEASYADVDKLVQRCAPALLRITAGPAPRFLALLPGKRERLSILGPDLSLHEAPREAACAALCRDVEAPVVSEIERILDAAGIDDSRRERARKALFSEFLAPQRIGGCWLIRPAGTADLKTHARDSRLFPLGATLVASYTLSYVLWMLSWWLLGQGVLEGRLDQGWLLAWVLILLTLIPFRLLATYAGGLLSVRAGAALKRRLLFAAFRLEPEEIRHQGAGQLLGRVMELETVEQMAITGGFLGVTALIELMLAVPVLVIGAGGWLHFLLLLAWLTATAGISLRYLRRRREWTHVRLTMTNDLVEKMVGHRTRLAQEARTRWHAGEDQALDNYYGVSQALDRAAAHLQALVPRGWFFIGVLGLVPAFVAGGQSVALLAIGVGGILLAYQAFKDLAEGLERILAAVVGWEKIRPLWRAASRADQLGQPAFAAAAETSGEGSDDSSNALTADGQRRADNLLLDVHDLSFRHRGRAEPVLRGLNLRVYTGDRILLEGPSGGGKSTLGTLLAACRSPDSGLLLYQGLDFKTLGREGWRRRVIIVPQFHENHVFMGTFAFNALMGRGWPPRQRDLEAAEKVCHALGLASLLERMPAGLQQMVGETGWQLSHGERGRLYIARALLQRADVIVLDESFAALDPATLHDAMDFVLEKAPTLIVIAHP